MCPGQSDETPVKTLQFSNSSILDYNSRVRSLRTCISLFHSSVTSVPSVFVILFVKLILRIDFTLARQYSNKFDIALAYS